MTKVRISSIVNKLNLQNLTGEIDLEDRYVFSPDINRPSFQLLGFWEHFEPTRIQVIGNMEGIEERSNVPGDGFLVVVISI